MVFVCIRDVKVGISFLNVILHVLLLFMLAKVYVLFKNVPPHVFVSSSALYPEFGVTVNVAVPVLPITLLVGAVTVPFVAFNVTV